MISAGRDTEMQVMARTEFSAFITLDSYSIE